jgi:uncharacterized protein (DUF433 family)
MRIAVNEVTGQLSLGMTEEELVDEHPGLEKEDFAEQFLSGPDNLDRSET